MIDLLVCWVLFPLAVTAVSLGCGLLLERAAGIRLPGALAAAGRLCGGARGRAHRDDLGLHGRAGVAGGAGAGGCGLAPVAAVRDRGRTGGRSPPRCAVYAVLRGSRRALGRRHVRRLHQARRHRHMAGDDRPAHGARPRRGRTGAVVLRGAHSTSTSASGIRWAPFLRSASAPSWSGRTRLGCSSPTRRCWPHTWDSRSTSSRAA